MRTIVSRAERVFLLFILIISVLFIYMQKGFITISILIIAVLGITVVGGGGYAVYKVNEIQQESNDAVAQLEERLEQIVATTTVEAGVEIEQATTSDSISTTTEEVVITQAEEVQVQSEVTTPAYEPPAVPAVETYDPPEPFDMCANIAGLQMFPPTGYKASDGNCVKIEDKCSNVEGIQDSVPTNMIITREYGCITEADLDAIEAKIASAEKAKREADKIKERCNEAEDELAQAEEEFDKIQSKLSRLSTSGSLTQEYRELSVQVTGKANEILILQSGVSSACYGYYYAPKTVEDYYPTPKGPTYTNCYSSGYGSIQCTSY